MAQNTRKSTKKTSGSSARKVSKIDLFTHKLELAFEKNQKAIIGVIIVIAIIVGGYYGYNYFIKAPKEKKAATALSYTQQWFSIDSFNLALNGNGLNPGALSVIKSYDGTASANLARFYAGVSYLKTGKPQKAIEQLTKFDGKGTTVQLMAYGALGDAYMETKNAEKGIAFYKKAAADKNNKFISPLYLFRAGLACEMNGKKAEAIKLFKEIKEKYPFSQQGQNIDKYLARLGVVSVD